MEVITLGAGEILYYVFNAIASLTSSGDFKDAIKIGMSFAFVWIIFSVAFGKSFEEVGKYYLIYTLISGALIFSKTTIIITDRLNPSFSRVVDNVPVGIAYPASWTSKLGDGIARLFDQNFSLPSDLKYSQTGVIFGSKIQDVSMEFDVIDPTFMQNISKFVQQCVYYDLANLLYTMEDLNNTDNLWQFISSRTSAIRMFDYINRDNQEKELVTCNEVAQIFETDFQEEETANLKKAWYQTLLVSSNNITTDEVKASYMRTAIQNSNDFLLKASQSVSDSIRQKIMINAINKATSMASQYSDILLMEQTKKSYEKSGILASRWVPKMRALLEILIYSCFSLLAVLFMLPIGYKIFQTYMQGFVYIQLWAPLYAILNLIITIEHQSALSIAEGAITLGNFQTIGQINQDIALTARNLMLSIPFIAFFLMKGLSAGLGHGLHSMMGSLSSSAEAVASEETRGNYSLGNSSLDNHSANNINANKLDSRIAMQSYGGDLQNQTGSTTSFAGDGSQYLSQMKSNLRTDIRMGSSYTQELSDRKTELESMGQRESSEYTQSMTNSLNAGARMGQEYSQAEANGEEWANNLGNEQKEALDTVNSFSNRFGSNFELKGYTRADGSLGFKVFGNGAQASAGVESSAGYRKEVSEEELQQMNNSLSVLNSSSNNKSFSNSSSEMQNLSQDLASNYTEAMESRNSLALYSDQATNLEKMIQDSRSNNSSYNHDVADGFMEYLTNDKGYDNYEIERLLSNSNRKLALNEHLDEFLDNKINQDYIKNYGHQLSQTEGENIITNHSNAMNAFNQSHNKSIGEKYQDSASHIENHYHQNTNSEKIDNSDNKAEFERKIAEAKKAVKGNDS